MQQRSSDCCELCVLPPGHAVTRQMQANEANLCQCIKGLGIPAKVAQLKHSLGVWQVIFGQVVIQACARAAEVWYACQQCQQHSEHEQCCKDGIQLGSAMNKFWLLPCAGW